MFSDPTERAEAVSVPLFYGIVEAVIISLYCVWAWKAGWTKGPADENFCVIISKTYEVEEEKDEDADVEYYHEETPKGWFAKLFVPREEEMNQGSPKTHPKQPVDRARLYSADVTVSTTPSSTPGTPETPGASLETIPQDEATGSDLEAPSMSPSRSAINASHDHTEVVFLQQDCVFEPEQDTNLDEEQTEVTEPRKEHNALQAEAEHFEKDDHLKEEELTPVDHGIEGPTTGR
jgi:hypothetical protein